MKIWLKILIALSIGAIFGLFIPEIYIFQNNGIFELLSKLAINLFLYLSVVYVLVKSFLGFLNLKRNKISKKIFLIFTILIIGSIFFSILISIGLMNLNIFHPDNPFNQRGDRIIELNNFDSILLKIMNQNLLSIFDGAIKFILPIIFLALILSSAAYYSEKKGLYFVELLESIDAILDKIVKIIIEIFPIGAIFIIANFLKLESFSQDNLTFLMRPFIAIIILSITVTIAYIIIMNSLIKKKSVSFFIGFLGAGLTALVTGNTAASIIPVTEHLKKNLGVDKKLADTLGPLGMILNKSGTVIVSTVVIMSLIQIYTPDILNFRLQLAFIFLIFLYSFSLDGANTNGFLVIVALILNFPSLHLEQDSYLLFLASVPILSRIGIFIDVLSTSIFLHITANISNMAKRKEYIDFI